VTLTQTERDLRSFAQAKLAMCLRDITQSFEIAGISEDALPCLGVELLKAAAAFCVFCGLSRKEFLKCAGEHYDRSHDHQHDAD
jgi:hypothetical protein